MFINPITVLSLLSDISTGNGLVGGLVHGVADLITGDGKTTEQTNFDQLLESTKSSLNVTPQGSIAGLNASGAASLIPANSGEAVTKETIAALNDFLGNSSEAYTPAPSTDTDSDSDTQIDASIKTSDDLFGATEGEGDTDTEIAPENVKHNIMNTAKLDDPFGIKAAQANGSPIVTTSIAAMVPTPLTPADSGTTVSNIEGLEVAESKYGVTTEKPVAVDPKAISQQTALSSVKADDKKDLFKLGEKVADNQDIDVLTTKLNTEAGKVAQVKAEVSNITGGSEKIADKSTITQNANPNVSFMAHDLTARGIGDAARAVRSKEDLKEKLAEVDTYKVVNVTKRDNVIDLRLEPAQLGRVQIKFDFTDGKTNIMVMADRTETLDLLQKDTRSIQKILSENGIQADANSLSFNLRGQQQQQQDNNSNFFSGRPLSFGVQEEVSKVAGDTTNINGYGNYAEPGYNGLLNIIV